MKPIILSIWLIVFGMSSIALHASSEDPLTIDQAVNAINGHWLKKEYQSIETIIENRLTSHERDPFALAVKAYFLVFVEGDIQGAREEADKLMAAVQSKSDEKIKALVLGLRNEMYGLDLSESGPFKQQEQEVIHRVLRVFPQIHICAHIGKLAEQDLN